MSKSNKPKKMGYYRYLQISNLCDNKKLAGLVAVAYPMAVMTYDEWEIAVQELLKKKIPH